MVTRRYISEQKNIIKDKSYEKLNSSGDWLNKVIRDNFKGVILGPVYPQISRIKNKYHKEFLVKLRNLDELNKFRSGFQKIQKSFDGTIKNAVKLHDDHTVESVLIPTDDRTTACVSSQVGCSLDCYFCATSKLKRMRNL